MADNGERLSGLSARDSVAASANIHRYSRFTKAIKIIMPLCVLAIIGLLVAWPNLRELEMAPLTKDDVNALREAETQNTLVRPVFNTNDSKGRPVSIKADDARQNRNNADDIMLTNPQAEFQGGDNSALQIMAVQGQYNQADRRLLLNNNVVVEDEVGNRLETEGLEADLQNDTAKSNQPATLTTPYGTIKGQSVIMDRKTQTTTFQGPAKAVINR